MIPSWETEPYSVEPATDGRWAIVCDYITMSTRYDTEDAAKEIAELMNMAFGEGKRCAG